MSHTGIPTHSTAIGVAGGMLASLADTIGSGDALKTLVTAAIGATVSFFVSLALKRLIRFFEKKAPPN